MITTMMAELQISNLSATSPTNNPSQTKKTIVKTIKNLKIVKSNSAWKSWWRERAAERMMGTKNMPRRLQIILVEWINKRSPKIIKVELIKKDY